MTMIVQSSELKVATEFTYTPGPRLRSEGDYSGEEFLAKLLRPRFLTALELGTRLQINLDGAAGYPSSFLEEAFGGLAREFGSAKVESHIEIVCNDEPYLAEQIQRYIRDATKSK
jgi:hypothetical protein